MPGGGSWRRAAAFGTGREGPEVVDTHAPGGCIRGEQNTQMEEDRHIV